MIKIKNKNSFNVKNNNISNNIKPINKINDSYITNLNRFNLNKDIDNLNKTSTVTNVANVANVTNVTNVTNVANTDNLNKTANLNKMANLNKTANLNNQNKNDDNLEIIKCSLNTITEKNEELNSKISNYEKKINNLDIELREIINREINQNLDYRIILLENSTFDKVTELNRKIKELSDKNEKLEKKISILEEKAFYNNNVNSIVNNNPNNNSNNLNNNSNNKVNNTPRLNNFNFTRPANLNLPNQNISSANNNILASQPAVTRPNNQNKPNNNVNVNNKNNTVIVKEEKPVLDLSIYGDDITEEEKKLLMAMQ